MRLFTVKDFIAYNNPCFSCGEKIIFTFIVEKNKFNPVIDGKVCSIQLITSYSSSLSLNVDLKTNKFSCSDDKIARKYFSKNRVFLHSECSNCKTMMLTQKLTFNFDKQIICPLKIIQENLIVIDRDLIYSIYTIGGSLLTVINRKTGESILDVDVPSQKITLGKIKTRKKMLEKMKKYIIFS